MKLYQNIDIPGETLEYEDGKRKYSKFWNEGKWNNFIAPQLPSDCSNKTFVEIGSNAGLFLKMAEDRGFGHVFGVEADQERIKEADLFKKHNCGKYTVINEQVNGDFNFNKTLPIADVVLIANTHYYFSIINFSKMIDALRTRCLKLILVSAKVGIVTGRVRYDLATVEGYFKDWKKENVITFEDKDDPSPREGMYSVVFKGALDEYDTDDLYSRWREINEKSDDHPNRDIMPDTLMDFYSKVLSGESFELRDTLYYAYWRMKRPDYDDHQITKRLKEKARLAISVRDNGMFDPIFVSEENWRYAHGRVADGQHRLTIAKLLGHKTVLVRKI